jgi:N-acetylglucosaminyl-diphospho-decaprenol L-rhamnosyltransferase
MSAPRLSIIVVSFNTKAMTLDCVASVITETRHVTFELIVWDNASFDGSADAVEKTYGDRIRVIRSAENLGFAAANNRAAEMASGEFLLLLNPDTVVLNEAIDRLVDFANQHPNCGIWGGRTLFKDGRLNPSSCWGRQTLWSLFSQATGLSVAFKHTTLFNPEGMGNWDREGIRKVDIVSGCFLLIRSELWRRLGGFREIFFMYGEESDLCLRATHQFSASPMVTSRATIIHHGGASERVFANKVVSLLKAKRLLIEMHFTKAAIPLAKLLLFIWPVRRYLLHALLSLVGRRASVDARKAWWDAVRRYKEWA